MFSDSNPCCLSRAHEVKDAPLNWWDRQSRDIWKKERTLPKLVRVELDFFLQCATCLVVVNFTWKAGADRDDTEQNRGEQQQRGPVLASVRRAGERQQHPWGLFSGTENRRRGRRLLSFHHHLSLMFGIFSCFFFMFFLRERPSAQSTRSDKPNGSHRGAACPHTAYCNPWQS